jgi:hypothetical protein
MKIEEKNYYIYKIYSEYGELIYVHGSYEKICDQEIRLLFVNKNIDIEYESNFYYSSNSIECYSELQGLLEVDKIIIKNNINKKYCNIYKDNISINDIEEDIDVFVSDFINFEILMLLTKSLDKLRYDIYEEHEDIIDEEMMLYGFIGYIMIQNNKYIISSDTNMTELIQKIYVTDDDSYNGKLCKLLKKFNIETDEIGFLEKFISINDLSKNYLIYKQK